MFFALSLVGICHHAIWLDEAQHFLLARDSNTLPQLIFACRNEGHPLLWNVILFIITRFSFNVFYMQLIHVLISCVTVFIICKSNLNTCEKLFIIFGYYIFYEYNIISRNYGISALLIFLLIHTYLQNKEAILKLSIIIFLLANTHLFSLLFSIAFVFTYIIHHKSTFSKQSKTTITAAISIILSGWLLSAYCIHPPDGYASKFIAYDSSGYFSVERILKTISACLKGIFYMPDYNAEGHHFENSIYYLTLNLKTWVIYFFSIIAIAIPILILRKSSFATTLFCLFLLIFTLAYFFLPLTFGIRYFGFFYIIFITCYWLAHKQITKCWRRVVLVIFALQFINGIYAFSMGLCYPFSESKTVSNYVKQVRKPHENIFILNKSLRPAISAYSGEKYFGVENGQPLSYCLWDTALHDSILKIKLQTALNSDSTSLIIANSPFNNLLDTTKLVTLKAFNNSIMQGEDATIYRYKK